VPDQDQSSQLLKRAAWLAVIVIVAAIAAAVWMYPRLARSGAARQTAGTGAAPGGSGTGAAAGAATLRLSDAPAPVVFGSVLVNDLRVAEVGRGTPIAVACVLEAHPTATVAVAGLSDLRPAVTANGQAVPSEWDALPAPTGPLAPRRSLMLVWIAKTPLPPGTYEVGVPGMPAALRLAEAGLTGARIDAASLVVRAEADTPDEAARAARRIMGLRGRHDERIAAVRAALVREPDRLSLGRELVEALDAAGRPAEALNELLGIAQRFQKRQAAANPAAPEELPDWMLLRFAELEQRTKTAK